MIKDVLRLSGIVILILNISNLGKDAKKKLQELIRYFTKSFGIFPRF